MCENELLVTLLTIILDLNVNFRYKNKYYTMKEAGLDKSYHQRNKKKKRDSKNKNAGRRMLAEMLSE